MKKSLEEKVSKLFSENVEFFLNILSKKKISNFFQKYSFNLTTVIQISDLLFPGPNLNQMGDLLQDIHGKDR